MNYNLAKEDKISKVAVAFMVLLISSAFFLGIAILDGPIWCVDSLSYTSMDFFREPLYPTFLWILRTIFGEAIYRNDLPIYLFVAVIIQSVLWVYVTLMTTLYVFDLADGFFYRDGVYVRRVDKRKSRIHLIVFTTLLFQFLTPILNRFVVKRGSMYSECIMTESLAMPLFVLFCVRLSRWLVHKYKRDFVSLVLIAFIIVNIRKQMTVVLVLWIGASFICNVLMKKTRSIKRFFIVILTIIIISFASKLLDCTYNYFARGVFHEHTGNGMGALCVMMYSADREDADLFTDNEKFPGEKELFLKIYDECEEQGLLLDSVRGADWSDLTIHFAESYDVIGYDIVVPATFEYIREQNPDIEYNQLRIMDSEIESHMAKVLMGQDKKDILTVYGANLIRGFAYSNAKASPFILVIISFVLYGIYVLLFVIFGVMAAGEELMNDTEIFVFGGVSLLGLIINTGVVALLIFPQGRYMAYATGLFYTTLILLLGGIVWKRRKAT